MKTADTSQHGSVHTVTTYGVDATTTGPPRPTAATCLRRAEDRPILGTPQRRARRSSDVGGETRCRLQGGSRHLATRGAQPFQNLILRYGTKRGPVRNKHHNVSKQRDGRGRPTERQQSIAAETNSRREEMETERKQPVAQIRIGRLKATIWENTSSSSNGPWHNTQFCRLFKNDADGEWNESTNFGRDELLTLAELARETFRWIAEHEGRLSIKAGQTEPDHVMD